MTMIRGSFLERTDEKMAEERADKIFMRYIYGAMLGGILTGGGTGYAIYNNFHVPSAVRPALQQRENLLNDIKRLKGLENYVKNFDNFKSPAYFHESKQSFSISSSILINAYKSELEKISNSAEVIKFQKSRKKANTKAFNLIAVGLSSVVTLSSLGCIAYDKIKKQYKKK